MKPDDLARYPLLSHRVVPQDWMEWPDWFEAVGTSMPKRARLIHFDSYPLTLQAAVGGQGIALGWRRTTEGMIEEGKLLRPCSEFVSRPAEMSVYRNTGRGAHADTDKLIAWLSDEFAAETGLQG